MRWQLHFGDILDVPADVLVCSANVFLNLAGGVGGAFLFRYGSAMQEALHRYLADRGVRHVPRGEVVVMPPCGSPYQAVLHAVAVNAAYESSPAILTVVLRDSLVQATRLGARVVALTALATGYGRMSMPDFATALRPVVEEEYPPIERVVIGLRSRHDYEELREQLPQLDID